MVAVVRYYETMYLIHDDCGERVYTGNDEETAKRVLKTLNGMMWNREIIKKKRKALKRKRK